MGRPKQVEMKLLLIIATVLGSFTSISTSIPHHVVPPTKYATLNASANMQEDVSEDDCPGTYCITDFFEGCCTYPGFVCCEETTRGFCAVEAKYCPPSNLEKNARRVELQEANV